MSVLVTALVARTEAVAADSGTAVATDPTDEDQRDLAANHFKRAEQLIAQGNNRDAIDEYRTSISLYGSLLARVPRDANFLKDLAAARGLFGERLLAQGEETQAVTELQESIALYEALAARDPNDANLDLRRRLQLDLHTAHMKLGSKARARQDASGALSEFQTALGIVRRWRRETRRTPG